MSTAHARPGAGTAAHGEALESERADSARRDISSRSSSGPMALLALQRSAGNRVASAYVQRQRATPPVPTVSTAGPVPQGDGATATPETETVEASETERASRSAALTAAAAPLDPPLADAPAPVQRGWLGDLGSAVGNAVGGGVRAVRNVAGAVRDRVLQSVTGMARRIPGYELLCVVLGRDVVTGTAVARTSAALIGGFLGLIPGSDRIRQNLQESGAIERAGQWLDAEVPRLGLNFDTIRGLFRAAWDTLSPTDLLDPAGAFRRIAGIFGPPLARLRDFALAAGKKMLEFVFEGVLSLAGGLGSQVMGIIRRASGVFDQIMANPVGFAGNLIAAVRGGLGAFLTNVATHLRNGLIGWLTGSLGGIIRIPAQFNLRGILGMAMDFLGITWDRVKGKLARLIGERAVSLLERGAGIVHAIYERGLGAITDRISEFTSGIVDTVLGGIREWVTNSVVGAAITRLISMFNPAGAVIQAIIAVYNTVQFFIERAQQLGALASAVFDSIAAIASGGIGGAIRYVEQALGRAVPVVLGFLARLIGLGDVAAPVRGVMQRVHTIIDAALDRVVGWIAGLARRAGGALRGRGGTPPPASAADNQRLTPAVRDANALLEAPNATESSVRGGLGGLRRSHGLRSATLVGGATAGTFRIHVQLSEADSQEKALVSETAAKAKLTLRTRPGLRPSGLRADAPPPGVAVLGQDDRRYLSERWQALAAQAPDPEVARLHRRWAANALAGRTPDPRASEQEIAWLHEHVGGRTQVSYRQGRSEGGEGSTRPDIQLSSWNIETKRYIINRPGGRSELIAELRRQYSMRLQHLPAHMQFQAIIVDVRGQYLTPEIIQGLHQEIHQRVVLACYEEARAAQLWWVGEGSQAPSPDTVTILAGEVG